MMHAKSLLIYISMHLQCQHTLACCQLALHSKWNRRRRSARGKPAAHVKVVHNFQPAVCIVQRHRAQRKGIKCPCQPVSPLLASAVHSHHGHAAYMHSLSCLSNVYRPNCLCCMLIARTTTPGVQTAAFHFLLVYA